MSTALTKNCPGCHAILATETIRCTCGHQFAPEAPSPNLVVQAETLYESHLQARLRRAMRAARLAKIDLLQDLDDSVRRAKLFEAENEIKLLEAQLILQGSRLADARATAARRDIDATTATEPSAAFRTAQAVKAEQALDLAQERLATDKSPDQATTAFGVIQSVKARQIAEQATQTCPGCGNALATAAERCECGHVRTTSDFLTTEEMAALRKSD